LSKLSQLKQDAYKAGKERDWERAISVYEQILEIEKKNPTPVNELGDIWLKAGDTGRAVRHFLSAASLYRKNGLTHNAVAIYKKILRYDSDNVNAHWYLAESRAGQGLKAEGSEHVLAFLAASSAVSGELKEIFSKRCVTLLDLYHDDGEILDKLVQVFRMWNMSLETARAEVLLCCQTYAEDKTGAEVAIESVVTRESSVVNYPEYVRWRQLVDPNFTPDRPVAEGVFADFGAVELTDDAPAAHFGEASPTATVEFDEVAGPASEISFADLSYDNPHIPAADNETSFEGLNAKITADNEDESDKSPSLNIDPLALEKDEDGCISIDTGGGLDEVLASAVDDASQDTATVAPEGKINLLEQILAEDDGDLLGMANDQLETITEEIGTQVGGDQDTADRQYEMGLVYLEMGMADKALASFQAAVSDPEFAPRAYEMWAMTLERANRQDEARQVLEDASHDDIVSAKGRLGILYYLAKLQEKEKLLDAAAASYDRILAEDPEFMDVVARRAVLTPARV